MNLVIFDLVNTVMALIIISALITLAWYLRILVPWGCYGWISNTKWVKRDFKRESVTSVFQTELYFEHLQGGGEAVSACD